MPYLESKVKNRMYKIQKFYQFKTPEPQTLLSMWHPKLRRRLERAGLDPRQYYCCLWKLNLCSAPKSKKKPQPQRFSIIILFNLCTLADLDFSYRQSFLERQIEQKGKRKQIILKNCMLSLCVWLHWVRHLSWVPGGQPSIPQTVDMPQSSIKGLLEACIISLIFFYSMQVVILLRGEEFISNCSTECKRRSFQRTYSEELLDVQEYNSTKHLSDLKRHEQVAFSSWKQ